MERHWKRSWQGIDRSGRGSNRDDRGRRQREGAAAEEGRDSSMGQGRSARYPRCETLYTSEVGYSLGHWRAERKRQSSLSPQYPHSTSLHSTPDPNTTTHSKTPLISNPSPAYPLTTSIYTSPMQPPSSSISSQHSHLTTPLTLTKQPHLPPRHPTHESRIFFFVPNLGSVLSSVCYSEGPSYEFVCQSVSV
ncbi:hypothetical protein Pmani_036394 [Petrolisthes manimaculis]|uniref:Uncharacterized protein n=1 Tax=Petrolisthes manimaculis TaxID=1843537 RepID=A0AAE1NL36_9EUCA|nr:hypothetical protein Pmani_036394 [Petrolisthes manimaculis]